MLIKSPKNLIRLASDKIIQSVTDGEGLRLVVFTQGCRHHCKGCQNPGTWDLNGGIKVPVEELAQAILKAYKPLFHKGITISGGDPMEQPEAVINLILTLKKKGFDGDIWLYSGYELNRLSTKQLVLLSFVDVLVDGPYVSDLKDLNLEFRGSSNQRIIKISDLLNKKINFF